MTERKKTEAAVQAQEKAHVATLTKRGSSLSISSSEANGVEEEKALAGEAALPVQIGGPADMLNSLKKLDSKVVDVKEEETDPFAHLPAHERDILKRQIDLSDSKSGYWMLYRYATRNDWIIFGISCLCTIAAGAAMPLMTVRLHFPIWVIWTQADNDRLFLVILPDCIRITSKERNRTINLLGLSDTWYCTLFTLPLVNSLQHTSRLSASFTLASIARKRYANNICAPC